MSHFGFASAPSNIALIKYWGKDLLGLPSTPSISMTLGDFRSHTKVTQSNSIYHEFVLNDTPCNITPKMHSYLSRLTCYFNFNGHLLIESYNNFPTSAGMASSASGYAALTAAIFDFFNRSEKINETAITQMIFFSMFGSNSSARSIFFGNRQFLKLKNKKHTFLNVHQTFQDLIDFVIVIDESQKTVSSSDGHKLANSSIFHNIRLSYSHQNITSLESALIQGDFGLLQYITEFDTLMMHATTSTSSPSIPYLTNKSSTVISELIKARGNREILWTADAGPNIHLIFNRNEIGFVESFLAYLKDLIPFNVYTSKSSTGILFK